MTAHTALHRMDYDILHHVSAAGETTHREAYRAVSAVDFVRPKVLIRRWNALVEGGLLAETDRGTYDLTERGRAFLDG